MKKCKDCGAEFTEDFLQCPQCGSNRTYKPQAEVQEGPIGTIISLVIIAALCGLIGLGVYYFLHPFDAGPTMVPYIDDGSVTTETTTTTEKTTKETTTTKERTTKAKLVGTDVKIANKTITIPNDYSIVDINSIDLSTYGLDPSTGVCFTKSGLNYCLFISPEGSAINSQNIGTLNETLTSMGSTELIQKRIGSKSYYYTIYTPASTTTGALYHNRSNRVISVIFDLGNNQFEDKYFTEINDIIDTIK